MKTILILAAASMMAVAIDQFRPCLECLYQNQQETAHFCQSSEACRYADDTSCPAADIIWQPEDCVQEVVNCTSMVFNASSFQAEHILEQTLLPGRGCWLEISRTLNGSWGQVTVEVDEEEDIGKILIYDDDLPLDKAKDWDIDNPIKQLIKGLVYYDEGWTGGKIFVANRNERTPAKFRYTYQGAVQLAASLSILMTIALY